MWKFRLIYSIVILTAFIFLRNQLGIDINYAVVYGLGVILLINIIEILISDLKSTKIIGGFIGGLLFLLISFLLTKAFETFFLSDPVKLGFNFIMGYIGIFIGYKNHILIDYLFQKWSRKDKGFKTKIIEIPKILDTSSIIDGRIYDIIMANFIESKIIIPSFVLKELQNIADSHDHFRRQKGKRGLDILKKIQDQKINAVEVVNDEYAEYNTVDEKLIACTKNLNGKLVTTDYNLVKVAEIHGVVCMNINQLALALRQTLFPQDEFKITIQKEGKEPGQGVGYLDDGTLVVVENGRPFIGKTVDVVVSSILQSESGRIVFVKLKNI
ncbi:PIN/TRAM domain-containing protein [Calditerrivibrio nitroreducens]|uniref:PilT protein domain protein n=1 Tax=Calditerrivibrio nitroreducens (strain DSM 19672 / NBRC 101217 / Yu37-1) TaxID=768670 RepID=E4TI91_CALNY|nr:PIN domain-containing protein [Calditerrivibrio nitroreducens]ADR19007.1 PilT protein domain protein [Calditerrivibrio nitroreducens DSM 19672]